MAYSVDADLEKYLSSGEYAALALPLNDLHDESARQIDQALKAQGYDDEDLAALTAGTLAALREVSSLNVLAMFFRRFGDTLERSDRFAAEYRRQFGSVAIATTLEADDDGTSSSGYVVLG